MHFFRQDINPNLAIGLLAVMTFWTVLFYFTHKSQVLVDSDEPNRTAYIDELIGLK